MKPAFHHLRAAVSSLRLLPHLAILLLLLSKRGNAIAIDLSRWADIHQLRSPSSRIDFANLFIAFMTFTPEFRNLFYLRAGRFARVIFWMCPPLATLQIDCKDVGPGLFIQHGIATLISAERIGANCWINQHVVIGFSNDTDRPTIGNNVRIAAGAKIIGRVTVGDNATIGLNTAVLTDVEPGVTLIGVPGRAIWKGHAKSR